MIINNKACELAGEEGKEKKNEPLYGEIVQKMTERNSPKPLGCCKGVKSASDQSVGSCLSLPRVLQQGLAIFLVAPCLDTNPS